jgi:CobQ/CobB/MinD/ParA nucleotide binding domain
VLALASSKGGVGRTTLCAALAVRAVQRGRPVALIDRDPSENLASWADRGGRRSNPHLIDIDSSNKGPQKGTPTPGTERSLVRECARLLVVDGVTIAVGASKSPGASYSNLSTASRQQRIEHRAEVDGADLVQLHLTDEERGSHSATALARVSSVGSGHSSSPAVCKEPTR